MTARYHINLFWSDEDRAWIADVPDLRFCSAHGGTPAEALAEVETAMAAWLSAAEERGLSAPPPSYRPSGGALRAA